MQGTADAVLLITALLITALLIRVLPITANPITLVHALADRILVAPITLITTSMLMATGPHENLTVTTIARRVATSLRTG